MKKIVPKKLEKGMKIGAIAPSNTAKIDDEEDKEAIKKSINLFKDWGFEVILGEHVYLNSNGYGADPKKRAEDINNMFANKEVGLIFCIKGGDDCSTCFDYIDFDLIKNNPKMICGFSDNTSLLNEITARTGLVTYHGTTFKTLSTWDDEETINEVKRIFIDGITKLGEEDDKYKSIKEGSCEGELIGGNLTLITLLVEGKYKIDFKDKILFLEDTPFETNPLAINRNIYYLKQNGVFDNIKGLWIGNCDFIDEEKDFRVSIEDIIMNAIDYEERGYKYPIIKSNNFGHIDRKTIIPIGIKALIDTNEKGMIKLLEEEVLN